MGATMDKRLASVAGVVLAVILGTTACFGEGNSVGQHSTSQSNLNNQKKAAIAFLGVQDGVEEIRFTDAGNVPGLGASWSVNAVVTIDSKEYSEILKTDEDSPYIGDPMPSFSASPSPRPVKVVFSDGTTEYLK
ncbi:hypothetical protein [Arthrobacter bambusae]|uniref:Secreted protein n=1 Tax=Arthrobacter bambusae TaxID=1338426 RepID=A0AAW8DBN2_9MICC|nr:hypothetical protein [Arthrobacter bambusae]MDP9903282.1 hypothetical protein [Arthrobacter bambusae]MDQ0128724.1 hypothetical protein [Arthrobacter bambusae]MDQ0180065.1 hypothetical protein [Arthrobacter bambusae]